MCELQVDLVAINSNLRTAAELAGGRTVLAAVKANAYGHGLVEVARSIEAAGTAEWLGVALVAEAATLRAAGIRLPILKFSATLADELHDAFAAEVTLTVGSLDAVHQLEAAADRADVTARVHLKVDTGMRRIGAEPEDVVALAQAVVASPHLVLEGIYTHLPVSDVPDGADFTREQLEQLSEVVAAVTDAVGPVALVHAANSGAILAGDVGDTNLIRPGIMAYGCYPDTLTPQTRPLAPALRWTSRVAFLKQVEAGETVGYGRAWTAPRDTWIATVAVGYGDGYSRQLSNRGRMLIDGAAYPIAGRVCMDQTMIDLGPAEPSVRVGDEVVLLGASGSEEITVAELAELMGTITYEVTCLIAARVPRTYVD